MRVLHLDSQRGWRGGECQAELLMRGQAAAGIAVAAVGRKGSAWLKRCGSQGVEGFENSLRAGPLGLWGLLGIFNRFQPDVVHCHDAGSLLPAGVAAGMAAALGWRRKRPVVVAARRVDFPIRSRFKYVRLCDRVIAVSNAVQEVLTGQGVPAAQVATVLDGMDPERFPNLPTQAAARNRVACLASLPPTAVVGLCVAALTDHKDHATLLKAWREVVMRHDDAHLFLAGDGELRPALEAQAAALGLTMRVHFLGWRKDIPELMAAADIFLLTSHHEGLGSTLMDAQFCGLPVVATRAGGIPEIVAEGKTGLMAAPRDAAGVAAAVSQLIAQPALRQALGSAGKIRAEAQFGYDRMVRETLAVYRELLAPASAGAMPSSASSGLAKAVSALERRPLAVDGPGGEHCAIQIDRADSLQK